MTNAKYKIIEVDTDLSKYRITLKKPMTFDELKEKIADAFHKGVKVARFYVDGRRTKTFLEVRKEQFLQSFIEECYQKIQKQNRANKIVQRIEGLKRNIEWNQKQIEKLELEMQTI